MYEDRTKIMTRKFMKNVSYIVTESKGLLLAFHMAFPELVVVDGISVVVLPEVHVKADKIAEMLYSYAYLCACTCFHKSRGSIAIMRYPLWLEFPNWNCQVLFPLCCR